MGRHSGKNAVVKSGSDVIDGLVSFDIEEGIGDTDLTAAGDTWEDHDTTQKNWSLSMQFRLDHDGTANQTLRAGDVITFSGYTEGDAVGKTYLSGSASVLSHKISTSHDGETVREYSCKGKGALSEATVSA
ncbi:hypothetical protein [Marinovum sp.]|uniref:hypothetical protein n=1 Tax=Marinovum sp. TaxID=2024839 RepID=UPI002B26AA62|nr:hypothetical protein [Marinovum sp.]